MPIKSILATLSGLLCSAALLLAAQPGRALTMDEAVVRALRDNLDLRAASFEVEKARGRLIQAGLWPNPELELSTSTDRTFRNEGERTTAAGFQQSFPISGRLGRARQVSRVAVAQAMAEIRNRERLLIGEVQRDFLTALLLRQQIEANRELLAVNRDLTDTLAERLKRAEVSQIDVNLARVEMERVRLESLGVEADLSAREFALKLRLGLAPEQPPTLQGDFDDLADRFRPEQYQTSMVVNRPDLRLTELSIDRSAAEARLARAEAWADWTLGADYEEERADDEPTGLETDKFLGFKLSIPVALWNRNQGRIYEQRAAGEQARQQFEAQRLTIRSEIATAIARARKLREAVENYRTVLLPAVIESGALVRRGYAEGLLPATQVVQVQQQQASLRTALLSARANYLEALVDLETATATSPHLKKDFLTDPDPPRRGSSYRK